MYGQQSDSFRDPIRENGSSASTSLKIPPFCAFHSFTQCSLLITPPSYPFLQGGQQCPAAFEATKPRCLTDYRPTSKSFPQASVSPGKMKSATVPHPSGLDLWGPNRIQGKWSHFTLQTLRHSFLTLNARREAHEFESALFSWGTEDFKSFPLKVKNKPEESVVNTE